MPTKSLLSLTPLPSLLVPRQCAVISQHGGPAVSAATVFSSLQWFNLLQSAITPLPYQLVDLADTLASIRRLEVRSK